MSDEKQKGFWSTLPGVLAAIGGLAAGVGGLVAALNNAGILGKKTGIPPDAPASAASPAGVEVKPRIEIPSPRVIELPAKGKAEASVTIPEGSWEVMLQASAVAVRGRPGAWLEVHVEVNGRECNVGRDYLNQGDSRTELRAMTGCLINVLQRGGSGRITAKAPNEHSDAESVDLSVRLEQRS